MRAGVGKKRRTEKAKETKGASRTLLLGNGEWGVGTKKTDLIKKPRFLSYNREATSEDSKLCDSPLLWLETNKFVGEDPMIERFLSRRARSTRSPRKPTFLSIVSSPVSDVTVFIQRTLNDFLESLARELNWDTDLLGSSTFYSCSLFLPLRFFHSLFGHQVYDWNYTTVPKNGVPAVHWPRGKVLGGSSGEYLTRFFQNKSRRTNVVHHCWSWSFFLLLFHSWRFDLCLALNFLVWDRASKAEYDAWEELGSQGWNWNNLYKYMRKSEDFTPPSAETLKAMNIAPVASDYGQSGPIQVSFPRYVSEQVANWIPALKSLGIPVNQQPLAGWVRFSLFQKELSDS